MLRNFNFNHPIDASMHYNRAVICLDKAFSFPDGSYLFYASLELRICIERILFEYLVIINVDEQRIDNFFNKYRIKNLSKAILEAEPEFIKKLEYTNFYLTTIGAGFPLEIPDNERLNSYYGRLGNYLHNIKDPSKATQNEEWWNSFIQLVNEVREYLFKFFKFPRAYLNLNEKGIESYIAFRDGTMSLEEIAKNIISEYK